MRINIIDNERYLYGCLATVNDGSQGQRMCVRRMNLFNFFKKIAGIGVRGLFFFALFGRVVYAQNQDDFYEGDFDEKPVLPLHSVHSSPIALSADNRFLCVVNQDSNSVSLVRTDINQVTKKINVGRTPRSVAISPNGRSIFVANSESNSISFIRMDAEAVQNVREIVTGAEPRAVVVTPDGRRVIVANRSQDTITVLSATSGRIVGSFDLKASACNVGGSSRHFEPGALAVSSDSRTLVVTRALAFTVDGGVQRNDLGKEGIACRFDLETKKPTLIGLTNALPIHLIPTNTGILDGKGRVTYAFPNQLENIVIRDGKAYLPNIAASPTGPSKFNTTTQAYINLIADIEGTPSDKGAINLHLGARDPEPGKQELYFANPSDIAFTTEAGQGVAYVTSAGSDVLVKLKVSKDGELSFTVDGDTTRYIDLNDPDDMATRYANAGKNPKGLVITNDGRRAYTANYVSRNISVIDLDSERVIKVIQSDDLPKAGSREERVLVGAEMFFSSRGNFVRFPQSLGSSRNRLSDKGRQNCASCHEDGLTDGIIWQFATGPRKTLPINGTFNSHDPNDQRIINATAIFDELEDADFNTRLVSSAGPLSAPRVCAPTPFFNNITESTNDPDHGLILGSEGSFDLAPCVLNAFLAPNANRPQPVVQLPGRPTLVKALDALVEWQHYGIRTPNRPMMKGELIAGGVDPVGGLDEMLVQKGRVLYESSGCTACHSGGKWTISRKDFASPPSPGEIYWESGAAGANQAQYLYRFLHDIGSFNLNVKGSPNLIPGYPAIGGIETDNNELGALGYDYNGDGKGNGYNISSILGTYNLPPYYHNGACETLECVIADSNHRRSGNTSGFDQLSYPENRRALVEFLKSIDANTKYFTVPASANN